MTDFKDKLIFLDTETTGREETDRLIEVAYAFEDEPPISHRFYPPVPISIEAMSVHHITNDDLVDKEKFASHFIYKPMQSWFKEGAILVAHNAPFDVGMLEREGIDVPRYICTQKVAQTLDKEGKCGQYKLQYLRYFYGIGKLKGAKVAHAADSDVIVLQAFFNRVLRPVYSIEEMLEITNNPVLLNTITFGKFKGQAFRDFAPTKDGRSYLEWMQGQAWVTGDLKYTVDYYLKN